MPFFRNLCVVLPISDLVFDLVIELLDYSLPFLLLEQPMSRALVRLPFLFLHRLLPLVQADLDHRRRIGFGWSCFGLLLLLGPRLDDLGDLHDFLHDSWILMLGKVSPELFLDGTEFATLSTEFVARTKPLAHSEVQSSVLLPGRLEVRIVEIVLGWWLESMLAPFVILRAFVEFGCRVFRADFVIGNVGDLSKWAGFDNRGKGLAYESGHDLLVASEHVDDVEQDVGGKSLKSRVSSWRNIVAERSQDL